MVAKDSAPALERKVPDILSWIFTIRNDRSAMLLSKCTEVSSMKRRTWSMSSCRRWGQVPRGSLRGGPATFVTSPRFRAWWEQAERGIEDGPVTGVDIVGGVGVYGLVAGGEGCLGFGPGFEEQADHVVRPPGELGGLGDRVEMTYQVRSALSVDSVGHKLVRRVAVVDDGAGVAGEHTDIDQGFGTAPRVHYQQGEQPGRQGVHPMFDDPDPGARLISTHDFGLAKLVLDLGDEREELPGRFEL